DLRLWRIINNVINTTRTRMHTTAAQALNDFLVSHVDFNHMINSNTGFQHGLSLRNSARETIKQKTIGTIGLLNTLFYQTDNNIVGYQTTGFHNLFYFQAQLGTGFNSGTQHIAG